MRTAGSGVPPGDGRTCRGEREGRRHLHRALRCTDAGRGRNYADEPDMFDHRASSATSKFTFRIDEDLKATVGSGEMVLIKDVPADRKVLSWRSASTGNLSKACGSICERKTTGGCPWLYGGYWHWIDLGWDPKLGCKCKVE